MPGLPPPGPSRACNTRWPARQIFEWIYARNIISYGYEDGYMRYSHVLEYGGEVLVFIAAAIVAGGDHAHVGLQEVSLRPGNLPGTIPPGCQNSAVRCYLSGYRGSDSDLRTILCPCSSQPSLLVAGHRSPLGPPEYPLRRPPQLQPPICVANSSKDITDYMWRRTYIAALPTVLLVRAPGRVSLWRIIAIIVNDRALLTGPRGRGGGFWCLALAGRSIGLPRLRRLVDSGGLVCFRHGG